MELRFDFKGMDGFFLSNLTILYFDCVSGYMNVYVIELCTEKGEFSLKKKK